MKINGLMISFLLIIFSSCTPLQPTSTAPYKPSTPTSSPTTIPTTSIAPTSTPESLSHTTKTTHYDIHAVFNYALQKVDILEKIDYTNNTMESITTLVIVIEPMIFPNCYSQNSLTWSDGQPVEYIQKSINQLSVPLPTPLAPGQNIELNIDFSITLPNSSDYTSRPIPFGYTERQSNLVDWYPFLPPYQSDEGWIAHEPGFYGEHNVYDIADYDVTLEIINAPANLQVAASSLPTQEGNVYYYQHRQARNFVWSASPLYVIDEIQVGDTLVRSYSFPFNPTANQQALTDAALALELGNRLFSPYPHKLLSVVEADFLDGMEYDGLFFLSRGFYNSDVVPPRAYITIISAHETAHQWFYAMVGNDQALEPWLDEAFATYFERIFYETYYPDALEWWWNTRINYFEPDGYINMSLYDYPNYSNYRNSVYLNGAVFFEHLRLQIGDQAFFDFLKQYTTRYNKTISSSDDFFEVLGGYHTNDIGPLISLYFQK